MFYHCFHHCGNLLFRGLGPEGTYEGLLGESLWNAGINKHVGFRVQQPVEESHQSLANTYALLAEVSVPRHRCPCDSTFFVFLQLRRFDALIVVLEEPLFWPVMCGAMQPTAAALRNRFGQLHTYVSDSPPPLCITSVYFQTLPGCVYSVIRSLQLSLRLGVSPPTPPWSLCSWSGITSSAVRMMSARNAVSTSWFTLLSPGGSALRCLPTDMVTSCRSWGSVSRRLWSTGGSN